MAFQLEERLPFPRAMWNEESFFYLLKATVTDRSTEVPRAMIVFVNFYIKCLWPDTERDRFERWGDDSINPLPWTVDYEIMSKAEIDCWFPHIQIVLTVNNDDDDDDDIHGDCAGLCPFCYEFENEKSIWICLYNRLYHEAFQNPLVGIRKTPDFGLELFSKLDGLSMKDKVAPNTTVLLQTVKLSQFRAYYRFGVPKFYFDDDSNTIAIPYWIGALINHDDVIPFERLGPQFIEENQEFIVKYVMQYTDLRDARTNVITKICTIENNFIPDAITTKTTHHHHVMVDKVDAIEEYTSSVRNSALGIEIEVIEGCRIQQPFWVTDRFVNKDEQILLRTGRYIELFY